MCGKFICLYYLEKTSKTLRVLKWENLQLQQLAVVDIGNHAKSLIVWKDRCFLGFHGSVGVVHLTSTDWKVHEFHQFDDNRAITSLLFSPNSPSELVALDSCISPKSAYWYNISGVPKYLSSQEVPSATNEHYQQTIMSQDKIFLSTYNETGL